MRNIKPVTVSLKQLHEGLDDSTLQEAFGPDSLGIIVIKDLPAEYPKLRETVLTNSSKLANLPSEVLSQLEKEDAFWLIGWSRGKEKLKNDKYDYNKGSFYLNCSFHVDDSLECPPPTTSSDKTGDFSSYKGYISENVYPPEDLVPGFKDQIKKLINLIITIGESVAVNCDRYIKETVDTEYPEGYLARIVSTSYSSKARLLHYYPAQETTDDDDWCGEHVDHSCLTGLTSALYSDSQNDGDDGGLFIKSRNGEIVKVDIPPDCLAFQSGSTLEEVSKGGFKAVPHYVKSSPSRRDVSRNTLAVFMQPNLHEMVNDKENFAQYSNRILKKNH
ncbi:hypothetical protein SBY92_000676 [Candida maltosa Xu316]|uniref:Fe2OG dioxygenase domain-containing protein n=1 Tax=Candida maltosa (strain Xu316) TaxID=1245528 RepID=M3K3G4_CANMX|nr:hypothetical protein G210_0008 [Candida maltosa Xu316]